MDGALGGMLKLFWYLVAFLCILNLPIFRRRLARGRHDEAVVRDAFRCLQKLAGSGFVVFSGLGILQSVGGFEAPVFPFSSPLVGSPLVGWSWALAVFGIVGFVYYLDTRDRRVAEVIASMFLGDIVSGRAALFVINVGFAIGVIGLAVTLLWI